MNRDKWILFVVVPFLIFMIIGMLYFSYPEYEKSEQRMLQRIEYAETKMTPLNEGDVFTFNECKVFYAGLIKTVHENPPQYELRFLVYYDDGTRSTYRFKNYNWQEIEFIDERESFKITILQLPNEKVYYSK